MLKKTVLSALVGLAATVGAASSAQAFYLNGYDGPLKFVLSGVDEGALYTASCSGAANCDATPLAAPVQGAVANEDSWGIFQVTSILGGPSGNTTLWSAGTGGEQLVGRFGGVQDIKAEVTGSLQQTWSAGGTFELFLTTDASVLANAIALGPTAQARAAIAGSPFLNGVFSGSADATVPGASTFSIFSGATHTLASKGFIDLTGGSYLPAIRSNTVPDNNGGFQDAGYSFSWDTISSASQYGWTVPFTGGVNSSVIPEPGSLALAGLGLMGLAALRRRKQQA